MTATKFLSGLLLFIVTTVICALVIGFTLATLWGWFIVPTFELPALSLAAAIGFAMVVGFLTYHFDSAKHAEQPQLVEEMIKLLFFSIFRALPTLLIGYIVHLFM